MGALAAGFAARAQAAPPTAATALELQFERSDPASEPASLSSITATSRAFEREADARQAAAQFARAHYRNIYPGIDVAAYGDDRVLEYVFVAHEGANPSLIRLLFAGGEEPELLHTGDSRVRIAGGEIHQARPVVVQKSATAPGEFRGGFRIAPNGAVVINADAAFVELDKTMNGTRLVRVPSGGQPGGPNYNFYAARNEVSNEQLVRFLNDMESHAKDPRGENVFFDQHGSAWINPRMQPHADELFSIGQSRLVYDPTKPPGSRFDHQRDKDKNAVFADHPASGISWYGAVKYCNWLTLESGRGLAERCYREGTNSSDWAPVTATNWHNGKFGEAERALWLRYKGFRLPMTDNDHTSLATNRFNEFFKMAAWDGSMRTNRPFSFGRNVATLADANFRETSRRHEGPTTPVGFFDGEHYVGTVRVNEDMNYYGLQDLSGNLAEWTTDFGRDSNARGRLMCGGSWLDRDTPVWKARLQEPYDASTYGGLRVATTWHPPQETMVYVVMRFFHEMALNPPEQAYEEAFSVARGEQPQLPLAATRERIEPTQPAVNIEAPAYDPMNLEPPAITYVVPPGRVPGAEEFVEVPVVVPKVPIEPTGGPAATSNIPPPQAVTVSITSEKPDNGVGITHAPTDLGGREFGFTPFARQYDWGTTVTVTAPDGANNGNVFKEWQLNGAHYAYTPVCSIKVFDNITLTAVYGPPEPNEPVVFVSSINPGSGVRIVISPTDALGYSNRVTAFASRFRIGNEVTLSAPATAVNESGVTTRFKHWLLNGFPRTTAQTCQFTVFGVSTWTAVYESEPPKDAATLQVSSLNPNSDVAITAAPADTRKTAGGLTAFTLVYDLGTTVTLTAPATAVDGTATNLFVRWSLNGSPYAITRVVTIPLNNTYTELRAEYVPPPEDTYHTLSVATRPGAGIGIVVTPTDRAGLADGNTPFTRAYKSGTRVALTAPNVVDGTNNFLHWERSNGSIYAITPATSITLYSDTALTAVYGLAEPPAVRRLTVESDAPDRGVDIEISPADRSAQTNGVTPFERRYDDGATVALTAPRVVQGTNYFSRWLMNGTPYSLNPAATVTLSADTTMRAEYKTDDGKTYYDLTIESLNPATGVTIGVNPADAYGNTDAATMFERRYEAGSSVTLTAPATAGANAFVQWRRNGSPYSPNMAVTFTVLANATLTAVYQPPGSTNRVLSVATENPDTGVGIRVAPADTSGFAGGAAPFNRSYTNGATVDLFAPLNVGSNGFSLWRANGSTYGKSTNVAVTLYADTAMVAVYTSPVPPRTVGLTVKSLSPDSGVRIRVDRADTAGLTDGDTEFTRTYRLGDTVVLTAPATVTTNRFKQWRLNGIAQTTANTLSVTLLAATTATAEYEPVPPPPRYTLTVRSENPASGIAVTVAPADLAGARDGLTTFTRTYYQGTNVTLTAQAAPTGKAFSHWTRNGANAGTSRTLAFGIFANTTATAVYTNIPPVPSYVLALRSVLPESGVSLTVSATDLDGNQNGATPCDRRYATGKAVTVTAPANASTNVFSRWLRDGTVLTSSRTASLTMLTNTTLTAVYAPVGQTNYTLTVESVSPASGVQVSVSVADRNGNRDGATTFQRTYASGASVTLRTPGQVGTNTFLRWERNGAALATTTNVTLAMTSDMRVTAVYQPIPPKPRYTLAVQSANPETGVAVTITPNDVNGLGNGSTAISRTYESGTAVSLTAPATASGTNTFYRWLLNGASYSTSRSISYTVTANATLTAVYTPPGVTPRMLTVRSQPDTGVSIAVSPADLSRATGGSTVFTRSYADGSTVTLTAPASVATNLFQHWLLNGSIYTTGTVTTVTLYGDVTLTAVYAASKPPPPAPRTVTVESTPTNNVWVVCVVPDRNNSGSGFTTFKRSYENGVTITNLAPLLFGSYSFKHWLLNGVEYTPNNRIALTVQADATITAVYGTPGVEQYVLTVESTPATNVAITVSPADITAQATGATRFTRTYDVDTAVTVTAPAVTDNHRFVHWERDGLHLTTDATVTLTMVQNCRLTAVYEALPPVVTRKLTVASTPVTGVGISVAPADNSGQGDGATPFTRTYNDGTNLTVVAPGMVDSNRFVTWLVNGAAGDTATNLAFTLLADTVLTAYYEPTNLVNPRYRIALQSENPDAGVTINASVPDVSGAASGSTAFGLTYDAGAAVTFTAPATAPGGNTFTCWKQNSAILTTNLSAAITVDAHGTLTAVYASPPPSVYRMLALRSENPDAGVTLTVAPADRDGGTDGASPFNRYYTNGATVTVTAPAAAGANNFSRWLRDGSDETTNTTIVITLYQDTTLTARYASPPPPTYHSLTVRASGITSASVAVSPVDRDGRADGTTEFIRWYTNGTDVTLDARSSPVGYRFAQWELDGTALTTNRIVTFTMLDARIATAVYQPTQALTYVVQYTSVDPDTGVSMIVGPADVNDRGGGTAPFNRVYREGTTITFTAPPTAGTNLFSRWQKDGVTVSPERTASLSVFDNMLLTAVYASTNLLPTLFSLSVNSSPQSGATITINTPDYNGQASGNTPFIRSYVSGATLTLTAPDTHGTNTFRWWTIDSVPDTTNRTLSVTMLANRTVEAVYWTEPPPPTYRLSVASADPNSGVNITVTPVDQNGLGNVSTPDGRTYRVGAVVTLTAPAVAGPANHPFRHWLRDGSVFTTNRNTSVTMLSDLSMTAVFSKDPPPDPVRLTLLSANPDNGVALVVTPADLNGNSSGATPINLTYGKGTNVNVTAPAVAATGTLFSRWTIDGDTFDTNRATRITLFSETTLTAVYTNAQPPAAYRITVASQAPDSGVTIGVTPADTTNRTDGATTFTRTYLAGTTVTLTAPPTAAAGNVTNYFMHWLRGAAVDVTTRVAQVTMLTDLSFTAVYGPAAGEGRDYQLLVTALSSKGGPVPSLPPVTVTPADVNGNSSAIPSFTRVYRAGTRVTLTARADTFAEDPNKYYFKEWQLGGAKFSEDTTIQVEMLSDTTLTVIYDPPPEPVRHNLTVLSSPDENILVSVIPADVDERGDGSTPFVRRYDDQTEVRLEAPPIAGTNAFLVWYRAGIRAETNTRMRVTLLGDTVVEAVFGSDSTNPPHTLTITASPEPVVPITASPVDVTGKTDGNTPAVRRYTHGTDVTLTAPATLGGGTNFAGWFMSGSKQTSNTTVQITMLSDLNMEARYTPPDRQPEYTLTVGSSPNSGVTITVAPADNSALTSGSTPFTRRYFAGTNVTVTAPAQRPNRVFKHWQRSGTVVTTNLSYSVDMIADVSLTAVYDDTTPPAVQVIVNSVTPDEGVAITVSPSDLNSRQNGTTAFTRSYRQGQTVSLTAPVTVLGGTNRFVRWELNGDTYSTDAAVSITPYDNVTMTAVYQVAPPVTWPLTLASRNPDSGVTFTVTPADRTGQTNGATPFSRTYLQGATVRATAPALAGSAIFDYWALDGTPAGTSLTASVTMEAAHSLTAYYITNPPPPQFTVNIQSVDPNSGVNVGITPLDAYNNAGGNTPITRTYVSGTDVTFTAPALAPNGNTFLRWLVGSSTQTTNPVMTLKVLDNLTVTAVYQQRPPTPSYRLTVQSLNPNTGVLIAVTPRDNSGNDFGTTAFTRTYYEGTNVYLSAPATAGTNVFYRWLLDGSPFSTNINISLAMLRDTAATAEYRADPPRPEYTLTVSSTPSNQLAVVATPADNTGATGGSTVFSLRYYTTNVTLTAPAFDAYSNAFTRWELNGAAYAVSNRMTFLLAANSTAVAVYTPVIRPAYTVTIGSTLPAGVPIVVAPADNNSRTDGATLFSRTYFQGVPFALTAPATVNATNRFVRWNVDGAPYTTSNTLALALFANATATAVYEPVPTVPPVTLTVESQSPAAGVGITVSPADRSGRSDGSTLFTRTYDTDTALTLTAPAAVGTNLFTRWLRNGAPVTTNRVTAFTILADTTMTAVYVPTSPPPRFALTVRSTQPDAGVAVRLTPADLDGDADGLTSFTRYFGEGVTVTLRAPALVDGTNRFVRWLRDGSASATTTNTTVTMLAAVTMTAVYEPTVVRRLLTVNSTPGTNVAITVAPVDADGNGNGSTEFTRVYDDGTAVTLTAPPASGTNAFSRWLRNGIADTTNRTATLTLSDDTVMTAVFAPTDGPPVYVVSVLSVEPDSGVPVTVTPADTGGRGNGATAFARSYAAGASVTLRAPGTVGTNRFVHWLKNGSIETTQTNVTLTVFADTVMTAVFEPVAPPPSFTATVLSANPASGVGITVSRADLSGDQDGQTTFQRTYYQGTNVSFTAPATAGTNLFSRWLKDGVLLTTGRVASVTFAADTTLTAVYAPPGPPLYALSVGSREPDSGVAITVSQADTAGAKNGTTAFTRTYTNGTDVTLTAPFAAGTNVFVYWERNGVPISTNLAATLTMSGDVSMTAVFGAAPPTNVVRRLDVLSSLPAAGVSITVTPADRSGNGAGTTPFARQYNHGAGVTVTAPAAVGGTNAFDHWNLNGSFYADTAAITLQMLADYTIEAVFAPIPAIHTVRIESWPISGVAVAVTPADQDSRADGSTDFVRRYADGASVTVAAPAIVGTNRFVRWLRNGSPVATATNYTVSVMSDLVLRAEYEPIPPPLLRTLTVDTSLGVGVGVTVSPADYYGSGNGTTLFTRTYSNGVMVNVTAPAAVGTNRFVRWLRGGTPVTTNYTATVSMLSDVALTALYAPFGEPTPPVMLSVASTDPAAGVTVTVSPADLSGDGNGATPFNRSYNAGVTATLQAPATVVSGATTNLFARWLKDGTPESLNASVSVLLLADLTMTAVYTAAPPPTVYTVTFASAPDTSGVAVAVAPTDVSGNGNGSTRFTRRYLEGAVINISAPATVGTNNFVEWQQNGTPITANRATSVNVLSDMTLTAVYAAVAPPPEPHTLTVASTPMATGVGITVTPVDNTGVGNGSTPFARVYNHGTNVTLTAPATVSATNLFVQWLRNGTPVTTNRTLTVSMLSDLALTAEYESVPQPVPWLLTVQSVDPDSGVAMVVSLTDRGGLKNGNTAFTRTYTNGAAVTVTAPATAVSGSSTNQFRRWLKNGTPAGTNLALAVSMLADTTIAAVYAPAGQTNYTLSIYSLNPATGVPVTVTPTDLGGDRDANTAFTRTYTAGTAVTLTAPAVQGSNTFARWLRNGVPETTNRTATFIMLADVAFTAEFDVPPATPRYNLTVASANPNSGVAITATTDVNGNGNGSTAFVRTYEENTVVTLTAPATAGTNLFARWLLNGSPETTDRTVNVTLLTHATVTAVYEAPPVVTYTLTFQSRRPDTGVAMTVAPADRSGDANGNTAFTRTYNDGTSVTVTAPASVGGTNTFARWLKNGNPETTARALTLTLSANTVITAEYDPLPVVTNRTVDIRSTPNTGVSITVSPADNGGNADGSTDFVRSYRDGTNLTVTAPATAGTNLFARWLRNGAPVTTNRTYSFTVVDDTLLTAVYIAPGVTNPQYVVTLQSAPDDNVAIAVDTTDAAGNRDGNTTFSRTYNGGTALTVTAPATAGTNLFARWLRDGSLYTTNRALSLTVLADTTLAAIYEPPAPTTIVRRVTVGSLAPNSGVVIGAAPVDNNGDGGAATTFTRFYTDGSTVQFFAPPTALDGGSTNQFLQWRKDGALFSTNRNIIVTLLADTVLMAEYTVVTPPVYTLTIQSSPGSGVPVTVTPADRAGLTDGSTAFVRHYGENTAATLTAPAAAGTNTFARWLLNGAPETTDRTVALTLLADATVTAVYTAAPPRVTHTLTVQSLNPAAGITVTVSPNDNAGDGTGLTAFSRIYDDGTTVALTAQAVEGTNVFARWLRNGSVFTTNRNVSVELLADTVMTAVYEPIILYRLNVASTPDAGIGVSVAPVDFNGDGSGNTVFARHYLPGTTVTLSAPAANGTNVFKHWLRNGTLYDTDAATSLDIVSDVSLTAVYGQPPLPRYTLTVQSAPDSGVVITLSTNDCGGLGDGATAFTREYYEGTALTLTAPATAGTNTFWRWLRNGAPFTTNRAATITVLDNVTMTAEFEPIIIRTFDLDVQSVSPNSGVAIAVSTNDVNGNGNGTTAFTRRYREGTSVTLTAPATVAATNVFQHWLRGGLVYSTNAAVQLAMFDHYTLTAVYEARVTPTHTVAVRVAGISDSVAVRVTPLDNAGNSNGDTPFDRLYTDGAAVTLTVPRFVNGTNEFKRWDRNGISYSTTTSVTVNVFSPLTMTAVYEPVVLNTYALQVNSVNPDSGVPIAVSPADLNNASNAVTGFTRTYYEGTDVTLTAPATAGTNLFVEWRRGGTLWTTNVQTTVSLFADLSMTAVYAAPPPPVYRTLTVSSLLPDEGVPITVSPADADGRGNGTSTFTRRYPDGAALSLTAPATALNGTSTNLFRRWVVAGSPLTTNLTAVFSLFADITATAEYTPPPPPPTYTLTVLSSQPDTGVPVAVSPADTGGGTNGATPFARVYNEGTLVTLVAPSSAAQGTTNKFFSEWRLNGNPISTNLTVTVSMFNNNTLNAIYGGIPRPVASLFFNPTAVPYGTNSTLRAIAVEGNPPYVGYFFQWRPLGATNDDWRPSVRTYHTKTMVWWESVQYRVYVMDSAGVTSYWSNIATLIVTGGPPIPECWPWY